MQMKKNKLNNLKYQRLLEQEKLIKRSGMHSFHRYFGKLIPAIPAFAIKAFTKEGDTVVDCFSGSGTTVLEAKKLNRNAYGIDINPLSVFAAQIKTTKIDGDEILTVFKKIKDKFYNDKKSYEDTNEPYCVNIDHWFKSFVKNDLLKLKFHLQKLEDGKVKNFLLGCFSAFLRGVSNADPQHVFPGYSKRMRKLDSEGLRKINVFESYERSVLKRIKYIDEIPSNKAKIKVINGDSRKFPKEISKVKLVVINPPYISSIRYLETLKIEMGWLGFILDQKQYLDLDKEIIGTERFFKSETSIIEKTNIKDLDKQVEKLIQGGHVKMAKVVNQYFTDMHKSISEMYRVLEKGGHLVIKISDSNIRKELIETHKYLIKISEKLGFKLTALFKDSFEKNSRSLMTSRNSYSGIMNHDWIIILKK